MLKASNLILPLLTIVMATLALAQPQPRTATAFDHYIAEAEARIIRQRNASESFLRVDSLPANRRTDAFARLHRGEIIIEKRNNTPAEAPGGLIHDWIGTVFVPAATIEQVLAAVRDYDHLTRHYSPDVMQSRLISHSGDDFHIFMRLRKHKVITVVLDTEYDVHYGRLDPAHQYSLSRSTRVSEIADPGTPAEHPQPEGRDHGFMWRLNSYWAFELVGDGVLVECEAISLTRNVPTGLGWLIGPFVHSIPRESLQFTLNATRDAVQSQKRSTSQ
jgi:hypothetical protein